MQSGTFEKSKRATPPFTFELTAPALDFQVEWERCNMLANYLAEYVAYQFLQRERAENLISTIVNELLEAVARLSPQDATLTIACVQLAEGLQINIRHTVRADALLPYLTFLNDTANNANDECYLQLLTGEINPKEQFNRLGLMMLAHDFNAHLSGVLEENTNRVYTKVFIPDREFSE